MYASFWKRLAAVFIDSLILLIPNLIVGLIIGVVIGIVMGASGMDDVSITMMANGLGNIVGIVIAWLYWAYFESSEKQATPGKMLLGIQVTDLEGQRISFGKASLRYFGKILSGLICLIGYIMAAFTEKKQALHDMLAGCLVVEKPQD